MDYGPIFRSFLRHKSRFALTMAQVAMTLAIVVNCVALVLDARKKMGVRTGFDEESLVVGYISFPKTKFRDDCMGRVTWLQKIFNDIRMIHGVRSVSASTIRALTDAPGQLAKPLHSNSEPTLAFLGAVDNSFADTAGLVVDDGHWFTKEELQESINFFCNIEQKRERFEDGKVKETFEYSVIISRSLGRKLFGEGPLLGKMFEDPDGDVGRVVGVIRDFYAPGGVRYDAQNDLILMPGIGHWYAHGAQFLVRTDAEETEEVAARISDYVKSRYNMSHKVARTMSELRELYFGPQRMIVALMGLLVILLVVVASLSISGITSFSIAQRTRQIGIRRALGATTNDILRYFLTEAGIVTVVGLALGSGLSVPLNVIILHLYDGPKLHAGIVAACALFLFFVALGSALPAALRASRISPAIATRSV